MQMLLLVWALGYFVMLIWEEEGVSKERLGRTLLFRENIAGVGMGRSDGVPVLQKEAMLLF